MSRQHVFTGTPWESLVGYARAVRDGASIHVSGTTATNAHGELVAPDDPYAQAVQVLHNIQAALRNLGADMADVVRTRIYVVNIEEHWEAIGRAHGEFFRDIQPVSTMVEVRRLIDPRMLVEIEADAIKSDYEPVHRRR
jgi:enamine deaminase RidA (YjgF/YER057c/UK114 family)